MPSYVTPKKNTAFRFYVSLTDQADTKLFKANPTLAAGDVVCYTDGSSTGNATVAVIGSTALVQVDLSAVQMNGDNISVLFIDAAGAQWCDLLVDIQTSARQVDDLSTLTAAQANAEVVDALATDTYAEPAQGAPAATASLSAKIGYLFKAWRNKSTQTSTQYSLYNDDAATIDHKATVSDSSGTTTIGEVASGP